MGRAAFCKGSPAGRNEDGEGRRDLDRDHHVSLVCAGVRGACGNPSSGIPGPRTSSLSSRWSFSAMMVVQPAQIRSSLFPFLPSGMEIDGEIGVRIIPPIKGSLIDTHLTCRTTLGGSMGDLGDQSEF